MTPRSPASLDPRTPRFLRGGCACVALLIAMAAGFAGCKAEPTPDPFHRHGLPFAEAFPDPTVLLTTGDVTSVRTELATVQLPSTREHHDELVDLLRSVNRIDVEHLLLLTEAVDLGTVAPEDAGVTAGTLIIIEDTNGESEVRVIPARGSGPFAEVVDTLLLEGAAKLGPVDEFDAGRLLGRTQSDEALGALADVFLPSFDATSAGSLRELLNGFGSSSARIPFVTQVLARGGTLVGEREDIALLALNFDDERVEVVKALVDSRERVTIDDLELYLERLSFDDARVDVLRTTIPKLPVIASDRLADILRRLAFDGAKIEAIRGLVDADRVRVVIEDLRGVLQLLSFDDAKQEALELLVPNLVGTVDAVLAGGLVRLFRWDSTKSRAIISLAPKLATLDASDRDRLLRNVSSADERDAARAALDAAVAAGPSASGEGG